ncbi:Cytochrome b-c1 complex subunit 7 [Capsicum annuum]|nr:Cytochrome b-c1 complex subunit 7 [Capsicum annuum]
MASSFSRWLVDPKKNPLAAMHMKTLSSRLRNYGLRYDDLYDPMYDLDVKEALNRLPREIVDARNQRLLRAMDLSMKHQYLPEDLQASNGVETSHCKEFTIESVKLQSCSNNLSRIDDITLGKAVNFQNEVLKVHSAKPHT